MHRGGQAVAVLLICLLPASRVRADSIDDERARVHFKAGEEAYERGEYEVAIGEFNKTFTLTKNPVLYFNMAACEEHLNHFQAASLLLRRYLDEKPNAEDREKVRRKIISLEERDDQIKKMNEQPRPSPSASPAASVEPSPAPEPVSTGQRFKYAWVALGVTGAFGVAAIGTGAYGLSQHGDLKSGCGATAQGCSSSSIDDLRTLGHATDGLIGVMAAAAVATVVLFILEGRARPSTRASVAPATAGWSF